MVHSPSLDKDTIPFSPLPVSKLSEAEPLFQENEKVDERDTYKALTLSDNEYSSADEQMSNSNIFDEKSTNRNNQCPLSDTKVTSQNVFGSDSDEERQESVEEKVVKNDSDLGSDFESFQIDEADNYSCRFMKSDESVKQKENLDNGKKFNQADFVDAQKHGKRRQKLLALSSSDDSGSEDDPFSEPAASHEFVTSEVAKRNPQDLFGEDEAEEENEGFDSPNVVANTTLNAKKNFDVDQSEDVDQSDIDESNVAKKTDDFSKSHSYADAHEEGGEVEEIEEGDEEYEEDDEPEETRIGVDFPLIKADLGREMHLVKFPNFLSIETRPFDSASYEDELDEDEVMDEEGRTRLKLKVESTIRWRVAKDADGNEIFDPHSDQPLRESNARMVRWSDNSLSLYLGKEIFDVYPMNIQGDYNYLFVREGSGLQAQAPFITKLAFRPHSTESFTHKKLTMSLVDKSNKSTKVKILPVVGENPEIKRQQLLKREEERLKAAIRKENKAKRLKERAGQREITASFLDNDVHENDISVSSIKKQVAAKRVSNIYSSASESGSEPEEQIPKKKYKALVLSDTDNSEESE